MADSTKAIVKKSEIGALLDSRREALAQVLPKHITAERMTKVALLCINENAALRKCTPASLFAAVMQSAETGLELGSALGHAYLVPYGNDAKFIPGYRGLLDLVRRSGTVKDVQLELVYTKDVFEREGGFEPKFRHVPSEGDRGDIRGAYCIFRFKDGGCQATYMTKKEIDAIRDGSKARGSSPWTQHYGQMALKTVVRRACKTAPVSREVAIALGELDSADKHGYSEHPSAMADVLEFSQPEADEPKVDPKTGIVEGEVIHEVEGKIVEAAGGKVKIQDVEGEYDLTPTPKPEGDSALLKSALKSIAEARKAKDAKRLGEAALFVKDNLKGDEHTRALAAYKEAKVEVEAREIGQEG
jgi:recombination protein RecT